MKLPNVRSLCRWTACLTVLSSAGQLTAGVIHLDYGGFSHGQLLARPGEWTDLGSGVGSQIKITSSLEKRADRSPGMRGKGPAMRGKGPAMRGKGPAIRGKGREVHRKGQGFRGKGNHVGVAVFDSGLSDTLDKDLEVDRGNLLYLQNNAKRQISNEVFSSPDDDAQGGSITWMFDKAAPVALESLVLADVDRGGDIGLLLEDGAEKTRWYTVPEFWTGQGALTNRPGGSGLLDFSKPSGQSADRRVGKSKSPPLATFTEDAGFDLTDVVSLTAYFKGSGAVGELTFSTADPPPPSSLPEPASLAVFGVLGLVASSAALRRRRCQR